MQTRDQKLALAVYERVLAIDTEERKKPEKERTTYKPYGSMAHKLPILIRTAGLAQALAFVEARGKEPHKMLLKDLAAVVGNPNLVADSRKAHLGEYMRLTQHTLAALLWFKRYAQSVLGVQQGEEPEESSHD